MNETRWTYDADLRPHSLRGRTLLVTSGAVELVGLMDAPTPIETKLLESAFEVLHEEPNSKASL